MTKRKIWILTCSLSLLVSLILPGQTVAQQPVQVTINQIDAAKFPDLTLYVTATDEKGNPIQGLGPEAFQLTEDGKRVSDFDLSTVEEERPPLTLAMAIDTSTTMYFGNAIEEARAAAAEFVAGLGPDDQVALFAFSTEVSSLQDFTADKNLLQERIAELEAKGWTALYEAIHQAASAVTPLTGRRAIVILTDGRNESDLPRTADQAIEAAQEAGVPVYALGFGSSLDIALERIATETGGRYLKRPEASDVRDLFTQLAGQLQSQYVLTYRSAIVPDMKSHEVAVRVTTPHGTASDSHSFIAIPVAATPIPTSTSTATPTSTATSTPTSTPAPTSTPTPTATSSPAPTSTPTATATTTATTTPVVATVTPTPTVPPNGGPLPTKWLPILGLALLLLGGGTVALVAASRRRGPRYCPTCGRAMDPSWRECLFCAGGSPPLSAEEPVTEHGLMVEPARPEPGIEVAEVPMKPAPTQRLDVEAQPLAWLVMTKGPQAGREFRLNPDETTIGRTGENDIILDDLTVSRYHARVRQEGEDFYLYDMAATNPTLVNGQVITRHPLQEGDQVEIGAVVFVFKRVQ